MSPADMFRITFHVATLVCCLAFAPVGAFAAEGRPVAVPVVFSQAAKEYQRQRNPDGSFRPEYYVFSFGGQIGKTTTDSTVEHMRSSEFVSLLQRHLARLNYLIAPDTKSAQLLLRVNWGKTVPFAGDIVGATATDAVAGALTDLSAFADIADDGYISPEESFDSQSAAAKLDSAMVRIRAENRRRDLANRFNAGLLGYRAEMNKWIGSPALLSAGGNVLDELRGEVEEARYYLIVFAFDFRSVTEEHKPRLQWVTRISIRAPGNRFDEDLEAMVARAAHYFGRNSKGLVRSFEGTVKLGETEVIGVVEDEDTPPPQPEADSTSTPKEP